MENIELKITENIAELRDAIESSDIKQKEEYDKKLNFIEDTLESLLDYIYAQVDNLKDLQKEFEGLGE